MCKQKTKTHESQKGVIPPRQIFGKSLFWRFWKLATLDLDWGIQRQRSPSISKWENPVAFENCLALKEI